MLEREEGAVPSMFGWFWLLLLLLLLCARAGVVGVASLFSTTVGGDSPVVNGESLGASSSCLGGEVWFDIVAGYNALCWKQLFLEE
jgi:hypothetical protein